MDGFSTFGDIAAACRDLRTGDFRAAEEAQARLDRLTKPQGSLGRLEELVVWLARWQGKPVPHLDRVQIIVFAGSHGVTRRGVSAFPAEVTAQMVENFAAGGAAINQLARAAGADLVVVPIEVDRPTADFTEAAAMDEAEFADAVSRGYRAVASGFDLLCLGEMGIGNTTAAAAICAHLFGGTAGQWVGRGTGVDDTGLERKIRAVAAGMALHGGLSSDPLRVLAAVGGRELAAIFGATLAARHRAIPLLLDGFASTAAASPLLCLDPAGLDHTRSAHRSAEQAHSLLLDRLGMRPILDLGMRLGEASGAAVAIGVLRAALACHQGMASFAEAGVSEQK
jgi:nicotinate-nucleotide--dimethylbenzimidazole phosphoribosyltransferase